MKKSFKSGFDSLLNSTVVNNQENIKEDSYTRTTIAIKSDLLEKMKISCLINKKRLRDVINTLIQDYLNKA